MPLGYPKGGIGYAAEFQSSALPWVTSSVAPAQGNPTRYDFPKVSRFLTVSNLGNSTMSFGFTYNGIKGGNKYVLSGSQVATVEVRVKSLWIQGEGGTPAFTVLAGLTTVDARDMSLLSGTLEDGSPGWPGVG